MSDKVKIFFVVAAVLSLELYSLFQGYSEYYITPFPFDDQVINLQAYIDYFGTRCGFLCIMKVISVDLKIGVYFFWLLVGYLVDYVLIYNNKFAIAYLFGFEIPLSYTLFMVISMVLIVAREIWKNT